MSGTLRAPGYPDDRFRSIADAALYGPRQVIDAIFLLSGSSTNFLHDAQILPMVQQWLNPRPGTAVVFPTFVAQTARNPIVGLRTVAAGERGAITVQAGFGGIEEVTGESSVRVVRPGPVPALLAVEGLADRRTSLQYVGLGQVPATDPRNHFAGAPGLGLYREQRVRGIVAVSVRPASIVELSLSTGVTRAYLDDAPGSGVTALGAVFERRSLPGAYADTTIVYSEAAIRLDTRAIPGLPSPGWVLESYGGAARGDGAQAAPLDPARLPSGEVAFLRIGGRAVAFLPIYRVANILSPKLTLDGLVPLGGLPVPFAELPRQPDFRGNDTRRDDVSLVGSLDYRWQFAHALAARLFVDAATVGPRLQALDFEHLRVAAGFGLDVYSDTAEVSRVAFAGSAEGLRIFVTFGLPTRFGDRQHHE